MVRYGTKRKRSQGGRAQSKRRRYVKGYRGGRPTYGTMARNAWPIRRSPRLKKTRKARSVGGKKPITGNFRTSMTVQRRKPMKLAKSYKAMSADHTTRSAGAFTINCTALNEQKAVAKLFQLGATAASNDGTDLMAEFAVFSLQATVAAEVFKKSVRAEFLIASASNANQVLWIYDIVCRKSTLIGNTAMDPVTLINRDYDITFNGTGGTEFNRPYTNLPPGRTNFDAYFRVLKKKEVFLNPGQVHKHVLSRSHNRKCKFFDWSSSASVAEGGTDGYGQVKDWTYGCLFVLNGFPVASGLDGTKVSVTAQKVNITWTHHSTFHYIINGTRRYAFAGNTLDPPNVSFSDAIMINDDDGTVELVAKA